MTSFLPTPAVALNRFGLGARPDEPLPADPKRWLRAQFESYQPLPAAWAAQPSSDSLVVGYAELQRAVREASAGTELAARQKLGAEVRDRYRIGRRCPRRQRAGHAGAVRRAPGPLLGQSLRGLDREADARIDRRLVRGRGHPAARVRPLRGHAARGRASSGDASLSRPGALDRPRQRRRPARRERRPGAPSRPQREPGARGPRAAHARRAQRLQPGRRDRTRTCAHRLERRRPGRDRTRRARARYRAASPSSRCSTSPARVRCSASATSRRARRRPRRSCATLAVAPATARHIATKLARHFSADEPAPALVDRLADAFVRGRGDLPLVYRALIESPEAWDPAPAKFKTPWEWTLSSLRGLGWRDTRGQQIAPMLTQLGQPAWRPGSPAGYDDIGASWAAPDALMRRIELAQRLAALAGSELDARALGPQLLPAGLGEATTLTVARAESPQTALALLLVSPEFMRR